VASPLPRRLDRPRRAALRVAKAVAEAAGEVNNGLDSPQQHEDWAEDAAGHGHGRHGLHLISLSTHAHYQYLSPNKRRTHRSSLVLCASWV
jgi:hypothetical protein